MKHKEKNINIQIDIENNLLSKNIELKKKNNKNKPSLSNNNANNQPIHHVNNHEYNHSLPPEVNAYYMIHAQKRLDKFTQPINNADFFTRQYNNINQPNIPNIPDIPDMPDIPQNIPENLPQNIPINMPPPEAPFESDIVIQRRRRDDDIYFDNMGNYIGKNKDTNIIKNRTTQLNKYKNYINGIKKKDGTSYPKPNKLSIVKYGLEQYFPDDYPSYSPQEF
jgi:hypothetical protein